MWKTLRDRLKELRDTFSPDEVCQNVTRTNATTGERYIEEACEDYFWHEQVFDTISDPGAIAEWVVDTTVKAGDTLGDLSESITGGATAGQNETSMVYFNESAEYAVDGRQWRIDDWENATDSFVDNFEWDMRVDWEWAADPTQDKWWTEAMQKGPNHRVSLDMDYDWIWDGEKMHFFEWYWHWHEVYEEAWDNSVGLTRGVRVQFGPDDGAHYVDGADSNAADFFFKWSFPSSQEDYLSKSHHRNIFSTIFTD